MNGPGDSGFSLMARTLAVHDAVVPDGRRRDGLYEFATARVTTNAGNIELPPAPAYTTTVIYTVPPTVTLCDPG